MSTALKFQKIVPVMFDRAMFDKVMFGQAVRGQARRARGLLCVGITLAAVVLGSGMVAPAKAETSHHKVKKPVVLPPLANGPMGPLQHQVRLDEIPPVAPQVSYQNSQLTIIAPNSTLAEILRAVRKHTGAEIEIPTANERVVTHLGPGPAREVVAELLNGSRFNYVLLGSPSDDAQLTRVVLVPKTGDNVVPTGGPSLAEQQQLGIVQATPNSGQQEGAEGAEAEAAEESPDENADQAAQEAEQPQPPPDQPGVKTPQEMLQEMQQRQLMLQQQQQPGMPPVPGTGLPQRPPVEQPPLEEH